MNIQSNENKPQDPWETTWIANHNEGAHLQKQNPSPLSFLLERKIFHNSMEVYWCTVVQKSSDQSLTDLFKGLKFFHFRGDRLAFAVAPPLQLPFDDFDANLKDHRTVFNSLRGAFTSTTERLIAKTPDWYVVLYRVANAVKSSKQGFIDDILLYEIIDNGGTNESGTGSGQSSRP